MRRVSIAFVLVAGAVALADPGRSTPVAARFSHASHAAHLDMTACDGCHSVDAAGVVAAPAARGHSPCQASGCHAADFVATGATTRRTDPTRYARATAFCLGCHDSADGNPPAPWSKPRPAAVLRSFQAEREFHVEMNHFEHTKRAECRACHAVDAKTLALVPEAPGHAQCVACHNATKFPDFTMAKCNYCHDHPSRAEFFHASRPKIDVRACNSEGHAALAAKLGKDVPCFRHERTEHRTRDGKPVECGECHAMVGKGTYDGHRYQSLADLHMSPIIDNAADLAHRSCGRSGCHNRDVDDSAGKARCTLCHGDKTRSIFQ